MSSTTPKEGGEAPAVKIIPPKSHKNGAPAAKASPKATVITQKPKTAPAPKAKPKPKAAAPAPEKTEAVARAEDVLDDTGRKIGLFLGSLSLRLRKATAVAREEVEDIWAEAQSIRQGHTQ